MYDIIKQSYTLVDFLGFFQLYQQQEAEAAMLLKKQKTFSLLEADHNEDEGNGEKQSALESRKFDKRQKRFRKKTEQSEDDDDDEANCFLFNDRLPFFSLW